MKVVYSLRKKMLAEKVKRGKLELVDDSPQQNMSVVYWGWQVGQVLGHKPGYTRISKTYDPKSCLTRQPPYASVETASEQRNVRERMREVEGRGGGRGSETSRLREELDAYKVSRVKW